MKHRTIFLAMLAAISVSACQSFPHDTTTGVTNVVMTESVSKTLGHGALTNRFKLGQPVTAYLTLYANVNTPPQSLDAVWYINGQKVHTTSFAPTVRTSPHFVWFTVDSQILGVGDGVVNVYADGKPLQSTKFIVR